MISIVTHADLIGFRSGFLFSFIGVGTVTIIRFELLIEDSSLLN